MRVPSGSLSERVCRPACVRKATMIACVVGAGAHTMKPVSTVPINTVAASKVSSTNRMSLNIMGLRWAEAWGTRLCGHVRPESGVWRALAHALIP